MVVLGIMAMVAVIVFVMVGMVTMAAVSVQLRMRQDRLAKRASGTRRWSSVRAPCTRQVAHVSKTAGSLLSIGARRPSLENVARFWWSSDMIRSR